jgi:ABC-type uncharacterized transport system involved in gliding motility auxiliary subunit
MNTRNQIFGTYAAKIAIAVLILVVAGFLYLRLDASRGKTYSLSKHTRETLHGLETKVVVKVFATQDLPQDLAAINRTLKDMLEEFSRQSRGKLRFEYVRTKNTEELIDQARQYNIPPYSVTTFEDEKMVSKEVVFGLSFEGGGESSSMYLRPGMETMMEYQLLKQLNKLQTEKLPEITVFADSLTLLHQYNSYQDQLATFFLELMENYRIVHTDLKTPPKPTPVMLCLGVIDTLSTRQLYNLDQYIMGGGKVVMTQDRALVINSEQGSAVVQLDGNLFQMLEHYGIAIMPNMVLDRECELGQGSGLGTQIPYPFFPRLKPNPKYPYTSGFENIVMNIASEIEPMPGAKTKFEPVLQTSNHSNILVGPVFQVEQAINRGMEPGFLSLPPKTVAAEISGPFRSYFSKSQADSTFHASTDKARIILFGDSEFTLEFGAGAFIVLNAIDHLLGRDNMVRLRSPRYNYNKLGSEVYMEKNKIQPADPEKMYSNLNLYFRLGAILLPLLLLALLGILLASRRKMTVSS